MNEIAIITEEDIKNKIYTIRGKEVMLDSDLAIFYKCANGIKTINQAVRRNTDRFPNDFYFQLTEEEYYRILRFQNGTLELKQGEYSKYLPHVLLNKMLQCFLVY